MKKTLSLLLCIGLLISCFCVNAGAGGFQTPALSENEQSIRVSFSLIGYNGEVMLAKTEDTSFTKGAVVFDVFRKILDENGIAYTVRGSYVSSIGGLSEFDCGKYSGWMYTVDGVYVNKPMTAQVLCGGEDIVVQYVDSIVEVNKTDIAGALISGIVAKGYTGKALVQTPRVMVEGKMLQTKTDYTVSFENNVKVGTAKVIIRGCGNYTGKVVKTFPITLAKPAVKVAAVSASAIKLAWNKVPGAQYYRVYEYIAKTKKYVRLAKVVGTTVLLKNTAAGSVHRYLVKACFINKAGKELCSPFGEKDLIQATALCKAPAVKAAVSGKSVTLKWGKCAGAAFYRVYEYNAKTGKYTTLIKSASGTGVKLAKRTKGTHYYLLRAFNIAQAGSAYTAKNQVKVIVK